MTRGPWRKGRRGRRSAAEPEVMPRTSGFAWETGRPVGKIPPFHSTQANDRAVHHDDDRCAEGNRIPSRNRREGTGGRPRCDRCEQLR